MKKRLLKSSFIMATFLLTSIVSVITYVHGQNVLFSEVNMLVVENLFAFADNQNSKSETVKGPALEIKHENRQFVDYVDRTAARAYFKGLYPLNSSKVEQMMRELDKYGPVPLTDINSVPYIYQQFITCKEESKYYLGERRELELNGTFAECRSFSYTSLPESGKPTAKIYYTAQEYNKEF